MDKKIRIIIIGFGSIGQKHYENLKKLGYRYVYVFDPDKSKIKDLKLKISTLNQKTLSQFKAAFICNPNHRHIKTALACAKAGCHLFIEKPLSHSLTGIDELISICRKKKLITLVGCNMRFHPCLKYLKEYLSAKKLGQVYGISHQFGYWLPYWRPHQDYRKNYAARHSTGGGIILDDIHEFDLLFWLNGFSAVRQSEFVAGKVGKLAIETEDICQAAFRFENGVIGSVHCDYLQKSYTRNCQIIGEKGNLEWDFNENIVWLKTERGSKKLKVYKQSDFKRIFMDQYLAEIKYFFSCLRKKQSTFNDLEKAKKILGICLKK